jgi:hypothetical protein
VRLDRKLFLIAPTIVLVFVVVGLVYAAIQLHVLGSVSATLGERTDFIAAVERGEKTLDARQAVGLLRLSMDVEAKRTAALTASRDLLLELAAIALVSCGVLGFGIRFVPREHWPRLSFGRSRSG